MQKTDRRVGGQREKEHRVLAITIECISLISKQHYRSVMIRVEILRMKNCRTAEHMKNKVAYCFNRSKITHQSIS